MRENKNQVGAPPATVAVMVNRTMSLVTVLTITAVIFYASFYPRPLFMQTISSLLTIFAVASATAALMLRQSPIDNQVFTFWDVAAVLLFFSLGAGMLSDPDIVKAYLQALDTPEKNPFQLNGAGQ